MTAVKVACCQVRLRIGDSVGNSARVHTAVESAARAGANVVVLPELCNSGYVFADVDEARALAESADGPTIGRWQALAAKHEIVIVGGFCECDAQGRLRNSAALVTAGGVQAIYRKAHLWDRETLIFTPGDDVPPVVSTPFGRLGVIICYDLEFPEWVRVPALAGAELLCVPTNWPRLRRPDGERPMELIRAQATASVNRIFIAVCDRAGEERGVGWVGGSAIIDADGWLVGAPQLEERTTVVAECRPCDARDKSISAHNDVHADRRPSLYLPALRPST